MKYSILAVAVLSSISAHAAISPKCPGEEGYYYTNYRTTANPVDGGFVAWTATIENTSSIVIGRQASICGNAIIEDGAQISGNAVVRGNAQVSGSAIVTGDVILEGEVQVSGRSRIRGTGVLNSGSYVDQVLVLNSPVPSTSGPTKSAEELAEELQQYVQRYAAQFTPIDGDFYGNGTWIRQAVRFTSGPCRITIDKTRGKDNRELATGSFHSISSTTFNMRDAQQIQPRFYSPTLSAANVQMLDFRTRASRQVREFYNESHRYGSWANRHVLFNQDTVESIEAPSRAHAEALVRILVNLMQACRAR